METSSREYVLDNLRGLRLREFDWNGAGGLPLRGDVADLVHDVFTENAIADEIELALPTPDVSLNANGTVEVAYEDEGGRQLLLTFECAGVVTYVKVYADEQTTVEGVFRIDTLETSQEEFAELSELFSWLVEE